MFLVPPILTPLSIVPLANVMLVAGSANFSTRDVWEGYLVGLQLAGINVLPVPTFSLLKILAPDAICTQIIGTACDLQNNVDAVIFVDGLWFRGARTRVPQSIKNAGVPTVLVATDDPYHELSHLEAFYSHRFTNEIRSAKHGVTYLPTATGDVPDAPRLASPAYDVSFVGTVFEERVPVLERIARECESDGRRMLIAGKFLEGTNVFERFQQVETRERTIEPAEKWEIYSQSRVTLNHFRKSEQRADSPSPRVFEVTAFGHAALLSGPERAEVNQIFGEHVYRYRDPDSAIAALRKALSDDAARRAHVDAAQRITLTEHTYEHRARQLIAALRDGPEADSAGVTEDRLAWIIGCGRSGSTWLAELLGDLPGVAHWHEPYFGRLLHHLHDRPKDLDRAASFFSRRTSHVWQAGLRNLFLTAATERYPTLGAGETLVVKEVNAPEFFAWIEPIFPSSRLILLLRDPFDVLDSYLDLQKARGWNNEFNRDVDAWETRVRRSATHIRDGLTLALDAFDNFAPDRRLSLRYEDLLDDASAGLTACARLLGRDISDECIDAAIAKFAFDTHTQTGAGEFRRHGKAGIWQTSGHFDEQVTGWATDILGPLRRRLSYA